MSTFFAQLPENIRETLATNAGIMLSDFDPAAAFTEEAIRSKLLFATTGGVNPVCAATMKDFGSDIDNCPKNTMELAEIESWECSIGGTALTVTADTAVSLFGAADKSTDAKDSKIAVVQPRMTLKQTDFKTIWYVCHYGTSDGFVAIKLENAISTGGFSMQSTDKEKGKFTFTYKGFSSASEPAKVPFTFYVKQGSAEAAQVNLT